MIPQGLRGPCTIMCLNPRHDRIMFAQRILIPTDRRKRRGRQKRHGSMHKVQLLHQKAVVRGKMYLLVKPPIGTGEFHRLAQERAIIFHHIPQHPHLFGRGMARGQLCRQPLQLCPHHIKLGQLIVIQRGHDQAAPVAGEHGLRFKPLQRLADGRARHTKAFGQIALDQTVSGFEDADIDCLKDQRIGICRGRFHRHVRLFCALAGNLTRFERGIKPWAIARNVAPAYISAMPKPDFTHIRTWVFDLDNTLYPPSARLFDQIEARMTRFVMDMLRVTHAEADRLRHDYWREHGTTLAGLMRLHDLDPGPYLEAVHDISLDKLEPDAALNTAIRALPGRKIVYTNGSAPYAERVIAARGLLGAFDAVYGVEHAGYRPKPEPEAFRTILTQDQSAPDTAAMFEDEPRNLAAPHAMGMRTVHVAPERIEAEHIHHHTDDLGGFLARLI